MVAYSASVARDLHVEYLEDLALALIVRHGCPIDVVNKDGKTARDILEEIYDQENDPMCLTLVSPPTTVLTLEEIAIRQILRNDICYLGKLPTCLCEMIEGGLNDSDLVRGSDDPGNDEEKE